jgi:threonine dehydratase
MIPLEWLTQADERISPYIQRTPLSFDEEHSIFIKWENRQVTGSFKARGAFNKLLLLEDWEREAGIVAASAGNHGQGVALAGQRIGAAVEVFVAENAVSTKVHAMQELGAQIHIVAGGYAEAERAGKAYAESNKKTWISPYNDGQIIAGQGTLGLEILRELPQDEMTWLTPVSGGGLLAGIGASLQQFAKGRESGSGPRLIGIQAEVAPFMHHLYYQGQQNGIPDLPSLADGLTGAVESGSVTIPLVKQMVDEIVLVSEEEIARTIAYAWANHAQVVEGAGAVCLAAVLSGKVKARPVVAVVSGGNIQPEVHAEIVRAFEDKPWG